MDDSQFDRLTRALGSGHSRRAALKAALGLGGAAALAAGVTPNIDAARRPTPTPKPVTCPGAQHWDGTACVCPTGSDKCGPDCCPAGAQCCDNACCHGECYGEELCCPSGGFVCNGQCRPYFEGACCTDSDCQEGQACFDGICQSDCLENGSSCSAGADCCSGICSAGVCYATLGGTCPGTADYCAGQSATFCNNVPSCFCAQDAAGNVICMDHAVCMDSCELCPAGTHCREGGSCCDAGQVACIVPCPPDGGGCFTGETRIAMADGTSRPVADVRVGDLVVGDDGAINRVTGIDTPLLGDRTLYGFDDTMPFVTGSHPFQTDDGWKAIVPADTYRDHALPGVRQIAVGDRLVRLSGALVPATAGHRSIAEPIEIRTEPFALAMIAPHVADPSTRLYNLRLDGNHTYFANDLLVHNK
jgi:hypothetical protein